MYPGLSTGITRRPRTAYSTTNQRRMTAEIKWLSWYAKMHWQESSKWFKPNFNAWKNYDLMVAHFPSNNSTHSLAKRLCTDLSEGKGLRTVSKNALSWGSICFPAQPWVSRRAFRGSTPLPNQQQEKTMMQYQAIITLSPSRWYCWLGREWYLHVYARSNQ